MIYILELPAAAPARVWFAHDGDDLQRKIAAAGGVPAWPMQIWPDETEALRAFEDTGSPLWQGEGWRARWALREQLVALEVLADDL
jgi:hypothetical protein